jgi:PAS domain S-box-containing protein
VLHWVAADGTILWANRADYEPLGYTREEWVGHHAAEFHADHVALGDMFQCLSKGETIYNYPTRLRYKNGSLQNVLIFTSVLFDDAGNFVHALFHCAGSCLQWRLTWTLRPRNASE